MYCTYSVGKTSYVGDVDYSDLLNNEVAEINRQTSLYE
jgi:hypothetical protein